MKQKSLLFGLLMLFLTSCVVQHALAPDTYNFKMAKNQLSMDYALIATIEHTTIKRLQFNQIPVNRAKTINEALKGINFRLGLSKKLLEAGNYKGSLSISKAEYEKLQILLKSLKGKIK